MTLAKKENKIGGITDKMERRGFTEQDWKLFRKKIAGWQEHYMERLCDEYMELLSSDEKASEKFWRLEKRVRQDKKKTGVIADMRRSQMLYELTDLIQEGAIGFDDLTDFSEELQETVRFFIKGRE